MVYLGTQHTSHSWTDSFISPFIGWTHSSSPLTAYTCMHTSSVGHQSLWSDIGMSIGPPIYILVPTQHDYPTLCPTCMTTRGSHHLSQGYIACPARVCDTCQQHLDNKTDPSHNQTHPVPLDTLPPPHDMVTTIEPTQEDICPPVPIMEEWI